jgi:mono/diheme cytochrome c family protein
MSSAEIATTIQSGKNNMPAFASKLTDEEIQQLVEYVRTLHAGVAKRSPKK